MTLTRDSDLGETQVSRTVRALSQLSMDADEGAFIGAEDELLQLFAVSRPTLRQAAKIVENERLIEVRRGLKGGFYATRPEASDIFRTLARYLHLKGASLSDIMVVSRHVSEEGAMLAAASGDATLRARLSDFVARIDDHDSPGAMVRSETELAGIIAEMSGNAMIGVIMAIGFTFGNEQQETRLYQDAEERAAARRLQRDLSHAVLAGDGEVARIMMRRRSTQIADWIAREEGTHKH